MAPTQSISNKSSTNIRVRKISSPKDLRKFVLFPYTLYSNSKEWVPGKIKDELNLISSNQNPSLDKIQIQFWLAFKDKKIVGRIASFLRGADYRVNFGFFDVINDIKVTISLISSIEKYYSSKNFISLSGPYAFNSLLCTGIQTEGFNESASLVNRFNYEYYKHHLQQLGFLKELTWVEYKITLGIKKHPNLARLSNYILGRYSLQLIQIKSKKELLRYADDMMNVYLEAYSCLDSFVPISIKEIAFYKKLLLKNLYPPYVSIIKNNKGELIAFSVASPSVISAYKRMNGYRNLLSYWYIYQSLKAHKKVELNLIAVKTNWKGKGVPALLMNFYWDVFRKQGVTEVETNHELTSNQDVQGLWRYFDKKQHKARATYTKQLR